MPRKAQGAVQETRLTQRQMDLRKKVIEDQYGFDHKKFNAKHAFKQYSGCEWYMSFFEHMRLMDDWVPTCWVCSAYAKEIRSKVLNVCPAPEPPKPVEAIEVDDAAPAQIVSIQIEEGPSPIDPRFAKVQTLLGNGNVKFASCDEFQR